MECMCGIISASNIEIEKLAIDKTLKIDYLFFKPVRKSSKLKGL